MRREILESMQMLLVIEIYHMKVHQSLVVVRGMPIGPCRTFVRLSGSLEVPLTKRAKNSQKLPGIQNSVRNFTKMTMTLGSIRKSTYGS